MVRIAICDDDQNFLYEMRDLIQNIIYLRNINYHLAVFQSGEDLLMDTENTGEYDIVFLDIELVHMNGIKTAAILREKYPMLLLIFVSCHTGYYRQAFEVQPYYFLDKPINRTKVYNLCNKAITLVMNNMEKINFHCNRIYYSLKIGDIIYLESEKRVVKIVCHDKEYEFYDKLEHLERYLKEKQQRFLRIHKSYLINAEYIKEFRNDYVIMSNGKELVVSREKRKDVRQYFTKIVINNDL